MSFFTRLLIVGTHRRRHVASETESESRCLIEYPLTYLFNRLFTYALNHQLAIFVSWLAVNVVIISVCHSLVVLLVHINGVQMIKFTMGSSGNQKTHRRKPKRSTKSYTGYQNTPVCGGLCMPAVGLKSTVLPSSSLSTTSTSISSCCNTSGDSSKLMFSPVINSRVISSWVGCIVFAHYSFDWHQLLKLLYYNDLVEATI